jgi:hypothetical protein
MKKLLIMSISIIIILALASSVMAKADVQKLVPYAYPSQDPDEPDASGKAIVNVSMGDVVLEITVSAKGLKPNTDYTVYLSSPWFLLGEFTTNANGNGNFHINFRADEVLPPTEHIAINLKELNRTVLIDVDF